MQSDYNDVNQSVDYLNRAFSRARKEYMDSTNERPVRDPVTKKTTGIYDFEVDFCYLVNEIQNGPGYLVPKYISDANDMIRNMGLEVTK